MFRKFWQKRVPEVTGPEDVKGPEDVAKSQEVRALVNRARLETVAYGTARENIQAEIRKNGFFENLKYMHDHAQ